MHAKSISYTNMYTLRILLLRTLCKNPKISIHITCTRSLHIRMPSFENMQSLHMRSNRTNDKQCSTVHDLTDLMGCQVIGSKRLASVKAHNIKRSTNALNLAFQWATQMAIVQVQFGKRFLHFVFLFLQMATTIFAIIIIYVVIKVDSTKGQSGNTDDQSYPAKIKILSIN